jgi:hypothetical protein
VAVGIQSDAQHDRLAFFLLRRVRHEFKLSAVAIGVKPQAQRVSGMSAVRNRALRWNAAFMRQRTRAI